METTLHPVTYLYVEDNDYLRESIYALISRPGRDVEAVANAEAALQASASRHFDVLITDVNLPGMSGTDLARQWTAKDRSRWVVLCSGYDFNHGLEKFGPNTRSLPKSFEIEELESLLDDIEAALAADAHAAGS